MINIAALNAYTLFTQVKRTDNKQKVNHSTSTLSQRVGQTARDALREKMKRTSIHPKTNQGDNAKM